MSLTLRMRAVLSLSIVAVLASAAYFSFAAITDSGARTVQAHALPPDPVIYSETFDSDVGTFTLVNVPSAGSDWHFRNNCTSSTAAGHSTPGTLRWGDPNGCGDFNGPGLADIARSPSIDTADCTTLKLSFNYFLDFQEDGSFDQSVAQIDVNMAGTPVRVAANPGTPGGTGAHTLFSNSTWHTVVVDLIVVLGSVPNSL